MDKLAARKEVREHLRNICIMEKIVYVIGFVFALLIIGTAGRSEFLDGINIVDSWSMKDYITRLVLYIIGVGICAYLIKQLDYRKNKLKKYLRNYCR